MNIKTETIKSQEKSTTMWWLATKRENDDFLPQS
jgi:hypothetical protein